MKLKDDDIKYIAECLCVYDLRNPDNTIFAEDIEDGTYTGPKKDCKCDNCFYGRTRLANLLIIACKLELPDIKL